MILLIILLNLNQYNLFKARIYYILTNPIFLIGRTIKKTNLKSLLLILQLIHIIGIVTIGKTDITQRGSDVLMISALVNSPIHLERLQVTLELIGHIAVASIGQTEIIERRGDSGVVALVQSLVHLAALFV